jgi:hypothetical protein
LSKSSLLLDTLKDAPPGKCCISGYVYNDTVTLI